jgi:hypothetical protein
MKKILTLLTAMVFGSLLAQHQVPAKIASLKADNTRFKPFTILNATGKADPSIEAVAKNATLATINSGAIQQIVQQKNDYIEVSFPYNGQMLSVSLFQADIFNKDFHTDTNREKNIPYQRGVYYRGSINGDDESLASFSFFDNKLQGIVSSSTLGNVVLGKLDKKGNTADYIVYSDANMVVPSGFKCMVKDDESKHVEGGNRQNREALTERCVTMYLEVDYDLFEANGSVEETNDWVTAVFNNVQTLYANDDINVSLKSTFIWTDFDPYFGESSSEYLYMFNETRPVFDGDVGQLIGIDPGGLGGVAVTIDGLCSQENFSYSDLEFSFASVPTYSWTVQVITHEFGHLLGSPHTHACVWNGNGTAIDNCAPQALGEDWEGGECMTSPPTIPFGQKGTIMSYCHLVPGVGISFNNGFGPQPKQLLIDTINSAGCLSTDCINTCINTVTDIQVATTPASATVTWTDIGSTATSWEVAVMPYTQSSGPYTTVFTPSFTTTTPLNPNTYYKVRVRPVCAGSTPFYRETIFATGDAWCSGRTITDTGGANNNYGNLQSFVRVLMPNEPQKAIKLVFTAFSLEENFDFLTIYNGSSTAADTWGMYTGSFIDSPIVSSGPDGALTLQFFSDQFLTEDGFEADVSCEFALSTGEVVQGIDFTYYPNPTTGIVNLVSNTAIKEVTVYNVAGQILYRDQVNDLNTRIDLSQYATGTYFFKASFGEKTLNFKIMKN